MYEAKKRKIAIFGAGVAGYQAGLGFISGIEYDVKFYFDDDPELRGREILGKKIFAPDEAERLL